MDSNACHEMTNDCRLMTSKCRMCVGTAYICVCSGGTHQVRALSSEDIDPICLIETVVISMFAGIGLVLFLSPK
jgi:hypothetical protein